MATLGSLAVKLGLDPSQFRNGLTAARAQLAAFKASINDSDTTVGKFAKTLEKIGDAAKDKVKELAKFGIQAGAVASTAASALPLLIKAGTAIYQFGAAAVAASPMLLAFGAAGEFVRLTLIRVGPAVLKSFNPILDVLTKIGNEASNVASKGLTQLSAGFAKANAPAIRAGMLDVADAINMVVAGTLRWGQSTAGIQAIRAITVSTGLAMQQLAPHIVRVIESFGNMLGRIAGVSMAAGTSGLSGVLDRLAGWMDRVNAATVSTGLQKMKDDFLAIWGAIKRTIDVIKEIITFWHEHRQAIMMVQDALSILAIAFGGPVIAVAAAVGLIIRHWNDLKAAYQQLQGFLNQPINVAAVGKLQEAWNTVWPAVKQAADKIWEAIGPRLQQIWDFIKTKVIPAFSDFAAAMAPIVAFCINVLGPVIASTFDAILRIIQGAIEIITGIIEVFTGILTGNWTKVWEGIKDILRGAWDAIVGIFTLAIFSKIGGILKGLGSFLGGFFADAGGWILRAVGDWIGQLIGRVGGIPGQILSALGNLGSLLYQAGRNVIQGLINGIVSMISAVGSAIGSVASKIRNALPFSPAKEGPLSGRGSPDLAGMKIARMLASGILAGAPEVAGAAQRLAGAVGPFGTDLLQTLPPGLTPAGVGAVTGSAAANQSSNVVEFKGPDAILQMLRKLVRDNGGTKAVFAGRTV